MAVIISSLNQEQEFNQNKIITVGSSELNDFYLPGPKFELLLEFMEETNSYIVTNNGKSVPLFKGKPFERIRVENVVRLLFPDSEEYINIKVVAQKEVKPLKAVSFDSIKNTAANDRHSVLNMKLDEIKKDIDAKRISIIKQISHKITDLKKKITQNLKGSVFTHVALFWGCFVCAFGVTNYITGLPIQESVNFIHLPADLKLWLLYTVLIMGIMLLLKQGMFGYFYSKSAGNQPKMAKSVQNILIFFSLFIMLGVYIINFIYYLNYTKNLIFPFLITLFFTGITIALAVSSAYYKSNGSELAELLNKYEYREDFERVIKDYQTWIGHYINNLSETRKQYISDRQFKLRIYELFEIIIGLITSPFLAYGVSNTLALCFPEAAGWVRISGLRLSPVFLVLATFLIIFAFFLFVHGFTVQRKISNSDVIKHDGFSNYLTHCAEIMGLEATNRAKKEMSFAFYSAIGIILIEFTMNVSYFSGEIGQDLYGLMLSVVAALVPTALLIAETFLLGHVKFELYAIEEIYAKADKE